MQARSIKIVQTCIETGRERVADLCWASLVMISDRTRGRKFPSEVLDAMLWGDKVSTSRFAYHIDCRGVRCEAEFAESEDSCKISTASPTLQPQSASGDGDTPASDSPVRHRRVLPR